MENNILPFDESFSNAMRIAIQLTAEYEYSFIPNEIFVTALFCEPSTPVFQAALASGFDSDEIIDTVLYITGVNEIKYSIMPSTFTHKFQGEELQLQYQIRSILELSTELAQAFGRNKIKVEDAITALSKLYPEIVANVISTLLLANSLTVEDAAVYSEESSSSSLKSVASEEKREESKFILPKSVSGFLRILNDNYNPDEKICPIGGREKEVRKISQILMKHTKRNCVLIGPAGVGKTAIAEKFTWNIVTGNCSAAFNDSIVVSLDINAMIAGTTLRGMAEERFTELVSFLENNPKCILFIDEIHLLLGAGACRDNDLDLANALKPLLARGATRVIGATTQEEYERFFSRDSALKRRFEPIIVHEPKSEEIYPMIKNKLQILEKAHRTKISKKLVSQAVLYASCFNNEGKNPDKTLDLIDQAMAIAELDGRSSITKNDILGTFDIYFEQFKKMNYDRKKSVAYHEAGHYIVLKFSNSLSNCIMKAVSIMPAEDYLGVTVYEYDTDSTPNDNIDYYISTIGSLLAGRIAEEMYTCDLTSGASSDLHRATDLAKKVVGKWALTREFGNRVYTVKEDLIPENASRLNDAVNKLLQDAEKYATQVLIEKRIYLDALAEKLVEKGILSEQEINDLFSKLEAKTTN